jgi:hypothetical protein
VLEGKMVSAIFSVEGNQIWNVDKRIPTFATTGDDVRLVQYLLARTEDCGISVSQVDGVWGPTSAGALSAFEQHFGSTVLADGAIDPITPSDSFVKNGHVFTYKLSLLHDKYVVKQSPAALLVPALYSSVVLNMPNDGQCPPELAAALNALIGPSSGLSGDPSGGSLGDSSSSGGLFGS